MRRDRREGKQQLAGWEGSTCPPSTGTTSLGVAELRVKSGTPWKWLTKGLWLKQVFGDNHRLQGAEVSLSLQHDRAEWRQGGELEAAQAPRGLAQCLSPLFFLICCTPGHSRSSPPACALQPLGLSSHVPSPRNDLIPHMSVSQAPGPVIFTLGLPGVERTLFSPWTSFPQVSAN